MVRMTVLRLIFGNWFSRAYLLLVAGVAVFVAISLATYDGQDANLVGVWVFFVTAPWSMIALFLVDAGPDHPVLIGSVVVGALLNAALIGLLVRSVRRRGRRTVDAGSR
jgi:hypothetical protein